MRSKKQLHSTASVDLPLAEYPGCITVVTEAREALEAAEALRKYTILGFDTETRPAFVKGQQYKTALLQLAAPSEAYLFRLHYTSLPDALKSLLEDSSILKVGIAIHDDLVKLKQIAPFRPGSFIELANLSAQKGLSEKGIKNLSAQLLGLRISKGAQTSNWEAPTLTQRQIQYAAVDAWASLQIYHALMNYEPAME